MMKLGSISSWQLPGFRCFPGVSRDAASTAVRGASYSICSEKGPSVGLRASPGTGPVAGESDTHCLGGGSSYRDSSCYFSYRWKCLKLKLNLGSRRRNMDGNEFLFHH